MPVNLVEMVEGYLTPDMIRSAGSFLGESEAATQRAINGIVPAEIAALASQASTPSGAEKLTRMLDSGKYDYDSTVSNLGNMFSGGDTTRKAVTDGKDILGSVLGNKTEGLVNQIARFAGIRPGSSSSLLALAAPLIMSILGRQRANVGQSPSALASFLGGQKGFVSGLLPAGTGSILGWTGYESTRPFETVPNKVRPHETTDYVEPRQKRSGWLLPLVVLGGIALAAIAWLFSRPAPIHETQLATRSAVKMSNLQLPGGVNVSVPEGSVNYSLYQWLSGGSDTATPKRFVFDELNFETGTANLTPDSMPTVDSLAAILKAYPSMAVRLEGYTDSTGDAAANKKLSLDRATAVKKILVDGGIDGARIATAGYGQEMPIATNDTEEGRAQNRRTELVVTKR